MAEPTSSKAAKSEPLREMELLPRASSLMPMSTNLIALLLSVFSGSKAMVLVSFTIVGASLRSLIARL